MEALEIIRRFEETPPVFTNNYWSDFHGQVHYSEYNPKRVDTNLFKSVLKEEEEECVKRAIELFGSFVEVE